jgi:hypothetical protein
MNNKNHPQQRRMALIDHYAGRALAGLLSGPHGSHRPDELARQAFRLGEAMCKERAMRIERSQQARRAAEEQAAAGARDTEPAPPPGPVSSVREVA